MTAAPGTRPPHVLVAEDEMLAALALRSMLERRGYRVTLARDGVEALAAHGADPADVLVTDLKMPRLDGRQLVHALRRERGDLPVVVMTGFLSWTGEMDLQGTGPGPFRLMSKPLEPAALLQVLEGMVGRG
ncbi:MAG TPA: response regulator [Azospirillaceae bacterium]|nr:response regulator [Azospirillaceae bacterium]